MNAFGDLERLQRHLDARLESQPGYADVRNLRGLVRAERGDLEGARSDLEAALRVNADYNVARFNLAWIQIRATDAGSAERSARVAAALPADWREHLELVRVLHRDGAAAALQVVERHGAQPSPWWALDRLWVNVVGERWDAVASALAAIAARDADLPSILHDAGLLRRDAADRATLQAWAASYAGNPHVAALCETSADLLHAAGAIDESRRLLAWGASLSLDLCAYWMALGTQYESLGEERAALVALRRAVEVEPGRIAPRLALGWLFAARGLAPEAIETLEVAARLAPAYADVRYQLGLLYSEVGRSDQAESELRAAIATQPDYLLARLALGCLLESLGRNPEALELLQSVRRAGLRSADLESRLANLHARLGHKNQARRAQARARASSRNSVQVEDKNDTGH